MTVGVGRHDGSTSVHYLKLIASQGRILEGGKKPAATIDYAPEPGHHIVGFRGRQGRELDKIGPIFAPDFD